eukprot:2306383-Amphidinium_carterae.1
MGIANLTMPISPITDGCPAGLGSERMGNRRASVRLSDSRTQDFDCIFITSGGLVLSMLSIRSPVSSCAA